MKVLTDIFLPRRNLTQFGRTHSGGIVLHHGESGVMIFMDRTDFDDITRAVDKFREEEKRNGVARTTTKKEK